MAILVLVTWNLGHRLVNSRSLFNSLLPSVYFGVYTPEYFYYCIKVYFYYWSYRLSFWLPTYCRRYVKSKAGSHFLEVKFLIEERGGYSMVQFLACLVIYLQLPGCLMRPVLFTLSLLLVPNISCTHVPMALVVSLVQPGSGVMVFILSSFMLIVKSFISACKGSRRPNKNGFDYGLFFGAVVFPGYIQHRLEYWEVDPMVVMIGCVLIIVALWFLNRRR